MKFGMHYYLPSGHLNLRSNFNSEKFTKSETLSCAFTKVALKGIENSSERRESWCAHLFIEMGTWIHFQISILNNLTKSASFQPWFDHPWMRAKIAPNIIKIGVHECVLDGYLIYFKIWILRRRKKFNILGLGLTKFDWGPKWLEIPYKYTCRIISQMRT